METNIIPLELQLEDIESSLKTEDRRVRELMVQLGVDLMYIDNFLTNELGLHLDGFSAGHRQDYLAVEPSFKLLVDYNLPANNLPEMRFMNILAYGNREEITKSDRRLFFGIKLFGGGGSVGYSIRMTEHRDPLSKIASGPGEDSTDHFYPSGIYRIQHADAPQDPAYRLDGLLDRARELTTKLLPANVEQVL